MIIQIVRLVKNCFNLELDCRKALLTLHILAVIIHRFIFKENILKKMI